MDLPKNIANTGTENRCCGNCAYHDNWTWVCFNPEADDAADFTDESHVCDCWEEKNSV